MSRLSAPAAVVAVLAGGFAVAGCGTPVVPTAGGRPPAVAQGARTSLAYSEATSGATWAVLPMGATSGENQFWQLFLRPAGQSRWTLHTPPDVATSGALALGGLAGTSLVMGVRPSLYLSFSPVSLTADGGQHWTAGPPAQGLASVPDALAATPGGRQLLALSKAGEVSSSSVTRHGWSPVVSTRSLAASPAGQACGLTSLSAVGYAPNGQALLAGNCRRPGVAGIFSSSGGNWQAAGLSLRGGPVQVLRLVTGVTQTTALLLAGSGARSVVAAAWLGKSGRWTMSASLALGDASVSTTAFGAAGGVGIVLSSGRAEILPAPGSSWTLTPPVPAGNAVTIAMPGGGVTQALEATGGTLTVWQLGKGQSPAGAWTKVQTVKVPIQYGSSG